MIRFRTDTPLQVSTIITNFDDKNDKIVDEVEKHFKAGEEADADIFWEDEDSDYADIQFADGSVALNVDKDCFEVID